MLILMAKMDNGDWLPVLTHSSDCPLPTYIVVQERHSLAFLAAYRAMNDCKCEMKFVDIAGL